MKTTFILGLIFLGMFAACYAIKQEEEQWHPPPLPVVLEPLAQDIPSDTSGIQRCTKDSKKAVMCTRDYRPVLGFERRGFFQSYGNPCLACSVPDVKYYLQLTSCAVATFMVDSTEEDPVCGVTFDQHLIQFKSGLQACSTNGVESFFNGKCPKEPKPESHRCTKEEKNAIPCLLPFIYDPVCATLKNGSKLTFVADCAACPDEDVVSYVKGACEEDKIYY
jgi:hypothetical protein